MCGGKEAEIEGGWGEEEVKVISVREGREKSR